MHNLTAQLWNSELQNNDLLDIFLTISSYFATTQTDL